MRLPINKRRATHYRNISINQQKRYQGENGKIRPKNHLYSNKYNETHAKESTTKPKLNQSQTQNLNTGYNGNETQDNQHTALEYGNRNACLVGTRG